MTVLKWGINMIQRMNMLCYIGVLIGMISFFIDWISYQSPFGTHNIFSYNLIEIIRSYQGEIWIFALFFILGTISALISPLSCIFQFIGLAGIATVVSTNPIYTHTNTEIEYGILISFVSASMILISLIYNGWILRKKHKMTILDSVFSLKHPGLSIATIRFKKRSGDSPIISVNLLAIVGASIGVISFFFGWLLVYPLFTPVEHNFFAILSWWYDSKFMIPCIIFLIGTALSYTNSIGCSLQFIGLITYLFAIINLTPENRYAIGIGPIIGFFSFVIILLSIIFPVWLGRDNEKKSVLNNTFIFHIARKKMVTDNKNHVTNELKDNIALKSNSFFINYYCIIGIILAIFSTLSSWIAASSYTDDAVHLFALIDLHWTSLPIVATIFSLGLFISFITPVGGFFQLMAIGIFFAAASDAGITWDMIGIGPYIGLISALVIISSLAFNYKFIKTNVENSNRKSTLFFKILTMISIDYMTKSDCDEQNR